MAQDLVAKLKIENKEAKQSISELKQTVKNLKAELKQVGKEAKTSASGGKDFKQLGSILEGVGDKAGKADGVLSLLGGGITKLSGFFGVAVGAGALFNEMLANSQSLGDAVERAQMQAGTAVDYFAKCMATADFSNFLDGITTAITQSGKLANMLDTIATQLQILGVVEAEYQRKRAPLINQYYDTSDIAERKKILDKIHQLDEDFAKRQEDLAGKQEKAAYELVLKGTGFEYSKINAEQKEWVDLYLRGTSAELDRFENAVDEEWETWQKMKRARASGSRTADGKYNTYHGMAMSYFSNHDDAYFENLKFRKNLRDQQDRDADSPLTQARTSLAQANHGYMSAEANKTWAIRQQARLRKQEAAEAASAKRRASIEAKYALKGADANGNLHYKADAESLLDMENNVTVLTQKLKKMKPETKEFEETYELITLWKQKIEDVEFGKPGSMKRLQNELKRAQQKVDEAKVGSEEWTAAMKEVDQYTQEIADANLQIIGMSFKEGAKSAKDVNANLQVLNAQLEAVEFHSEEWYKIMQKIKAETSKIAEYAKGSIGDLNNQISEIDKQLQNDNLTPEVRAKLIVDKYELNKQLESLSDESGATIKLRPTTFASDSKRASYNNAQSNISSIESDYEMGLIDADQAKAQIAEVNTQLQALGMKPIQVHIETDAEKVFNDVADVVGSVGDAFSSMGQLFDDEAFDVAGIIAQAVAQLMLGYANASAQAGSLGPWGWIAFSVAGLAQVLAAAAAIKNATAHANGGVVGGSSFAGDNVYARLNSGEMVLNNRQQKNLFDAIDSGGLGANLGGTVHFKIQGKDLVGVLYNTSQIKGKTGGRRVSFA